MFERVIQENQDLKGTVKGLNERLENTALEITQLKS